MYYLDQLTCILVNLERLADLGIVIEMNFLDISHVKHFIVSELILSVKNSPVNRGFQDLSKIPDTYSISIKE